MVTAMPYDDSHRQIIKDHMDKLAQDKGGKELLPSAKLTVKGATEISPIYRIDLNDLSFNKSNGRIKSEVIEKEAEIGNFLDPFNLNDQKIIKNILLSIRVEENEKIKNDLKKNTQINPGIVTCDGIVINGNRRKALLHELYEEKGDEKFKYLDVHVLPSAITKSELWLIEAGIQLSAPQQLDYSPINHLLKLREGIDSDLSIQDMASRIYGVTEEKIKEDLEKLKLIDEYLSNFIKKPGKYYLVKNLNEHFINLYNILKWVKNPRGKRRDWDPDASDINELKLVAFHYIRLKFPHLRIRDIRDLFATESAWQIAKTSINIESDNEKEPSTSEVKEEEIVVEDEELEDDDEELEDDEGSTESIAEERDLREEAEWRFSYKKDLKSIFEESKEQEKISEDAGKPIILANRALKNLRAIPLEYLHTDEDDIDNVFREIIQIVNSLRKMVNTKKKKK